VTPGNPPIITTVAGSGCSSCTGSFGGDNGPATSASLKTPRALFMDTTGLLYVADYLNNRIRVVNQNNIITTFAGTGTDTPFTGETIPALASNLYQPIDVKGDSLGNIYIADYNNFIVRIVDNNGIIATVFGTPTIRVFTSGRTLRLSGMNEPRAIWIDSLSTIYITDYNSIHRGILFSSPDISPNLFMKLVAGTNTVGFGGDGSAATSAQVRAIVPWVDTSGNVYIPDQFNSRIRKVTIDGVISTFAGSGTTSTAGTSGTLMGVSFNFPYAVVGDTAGTFLYISDRTFVWKYIYATNIVSRFVGGTPGYGGDDGPAISGRLSSPMGLWLTTSGVLYIADPGNNRIRKVVSDIISTVAGTTGPAGYSGDNAQATSASLNFPRGVYMDLNGKLFIADAGNNRIRILDTNNIITTFAGTGLATPFNGDSIPVLTANLNGPLDMKGDTLGNIYIAEENSCLIRVADISGIISVLFGSSSSCGYSPRNFSSIVCFK
jgi:sugar lactone lactonase YvrE